MDFTYILQFTKISKRRSQRVPPNLRGRCALVWHKCHVSDDPENSKLCQQGTISFFSLMPCSSDTLGRNFTEFGTGVQCNKGFQKMQHFWVQKLGGGGQNVNFSDLFIFIISERIMTKYKKLGHKNLVQKN